MDNQIKILDLLNQKKSKEYEIENLIYGSIEIRQKDNKKYIYIHTRNEGIQSSKYIGEYNDELYNLIVNNNIKAKDIKKEIRKINKQLKELNYVDEDLSPEVAKNLDFAKKHLADTIYKQAILEGVATTLSDTQNIIDGGKVNNMSPEDILKIINLKHAWEFILNKNVVQSPSDYSLLCMINKLVEEGFYYNAGLLRNVPVKIGGTTWSPEIPIESDVKDNIQNIINNNDNIIDTAVNLLLYVVKKQMFIDGNKRTSIIFVNHYLISRGKGLIVIPADKIEEYKKLLVEYYENNDSKKIKNFIKKECYLKI